MSRAARRGKLDAAVVWKLDRFGRSALDVLANIQDLDAAGVRFIATTQGIDIRPGGDARSRLMRTMLAAVAEFERDLIRERTRLGIAKARATGLWTRRRNRSASGRASTPSTGPATSRSQTSPGGGASTASAGGPRPSRSSPRRTSCLRSVRSGCAKSRPRSWSRVMNSKADQLAPRSLNHLRALVHVIYA
jgi:hypothetical protein